MQRRELVESKRHLEQIVGREVTTFCYPFGSKPDVGETALQLVQEVGFQAACSTVQRWVTTEQSPFWLPRITVSAWDGDEFAKRLQRLFMK